MPLTDVKCRNAKGQIKPYKLSDGGGLHLLVNPDGAKYWRLAYRWHGKQRTLALGVYPAVGLMEARGVRVDVELLRTIAKEFTEEAASLDKQIQKVAGHEFKVNSPAQLQTLPSPSSRNVTHTRSGVVCMMLAYRLPRRLANACLVSSG